MQHLIAPSIQKSELDTRRGRGYSVTTMAKILAKLVKDGNSTAVRLPKAVLEMSGLSGTVEIKAEKGKVTLRKAKRPRDGWAENFARITPEELKEDRDEFAIWDATLADGLEDVPYDD